jgi:hypothetical protein
VDILSTLAKERAEERRQALDEKFHIAVRLRQIKYKRVRPYQVRKEGNRHFADICSVGQNPDNRIFENVLYLSPPERMAGKVIAYNARREKPKSGTDWRALAVLFAEISRSENEGSRGVKHSCGCRCRSANN